MKRILFLLYGVISYVIFFVTFCYAIGFVSGLVVPKHIDSTPDAPLAIALLINAALLTLFALQHSVMARPAFKRWWTQFVPQQIERSTYVLLASLCLVVMFWKWQPLGGIIWQVESGVAQLILRIGSFTGFLIVLLATFQINHFDLFGLRQVWIYFQRKPYTNVTFRTPLFYKYVRHPLYFGFLLAFWSTPVMTIAHLFFAVMTTGYILVAIQLEERDLINEFGESYLSYKRKLPMIIPFTKFTKNTEEITNVNVVAKKDN
jgi:methanethiol S-methyltransferase